MICTEMFVIVYDILYTNLLVGGNISAQNIVPLPESNEHVQVYAVEGLEELHQIRVAEHGLGHGSLGGLGGLHGGGELA